MRNPPSGFPDYQQGHPASGRVGYSPRIADPSYARVRRKTIGRKLLLVVVLVIAAAVTLLWLSVDLSEVAALIAITNSSLAAAAVAGLLVVVVVAGLVSWLRVGASDDAWDAVVVASDYEDVYDDDHNYLGRMYYVKLRRTDGQQETIFEDTPLYYGRLRDGERVRKHRGLPGYERYDKSDPEIICVACQHLTSTQADRCPNCDVPLLS